MAKAGVDWERIEADYSAGVKSIREIARENDITDRAIRDRAKSRDWTRDVSAKVAAKAEKLLRNAELRTELRAESQATEREVIEASAQAIVNVKLSHRKSIARQRTLVETLTTELETQTADTELFAQLGELMRSEDSKGVDKLNDLYRKVIAFPQRIDSMKKLAETLKHLIYLEREAFDITPAPTPTDTALSSIAKAIQGNTFMPVASPVESGDDDDEEN